MPTGPHQLQGVPPDPSLRARGYARPEVLVSTDWVAQHADQPWLRILECDEDVLLYDLGHVPGAQKLDWHTDLNDQVVRDYVDRAQFEALVRRLGVGDDTIVVFYGDKNNWWATYAFWVFRLFGFDERRLRVMDGGRAKWEAEDRPMTTDRPSFAPSDYVAPERDDARIRAFMDDVRQHVARRGQLIDVRSPQEFTGERTHMPDYPQEGTLRGGHIPGAQSVPWARAANPDGTFRSAEELRAIYEQEAGLHPSADVIAYCRIGERSSHTWFVLTYLLGYARVRNYDGSWTEWGNAVRAPIETGPARPPAAEGAA
jgi:thiosulfate/3-mercaptopyruvate sulfurtransferase